MNQQNSSMLRNTNSPYERIHRGSTTLIVCTLCLAGIAFGQPSQTPTTDPASSSEPLHTMIPVHIDATTGDIKVGRTTYHGAPDTLHVLALKRDPNPSNLGAVDLIGDRLTTNPNAYADFLLSITDRDPLLIVNAPGSNYGIAVNALDLNAFGGQVDLEGISYSLPFVFIGNGGRQPGGALQRGYSNLPVDGFLAPDTGGKYTFIQTDYVRYEHYDHRNDPNWW